jgi:hypothetical protein
MTDSTLRAFDRQCPFGHSRCEKESNLDGEVKLANEGEFRSRVDEKAQVETAVDGSLSMLLNNLKSNFGAGWDANIPAPSKYTVCSGCASSTAEALLQVLTWSRSRLNNVTFP